MAIYILSMLLAFFQLPAFSQGGPSNVEDDRSSNEGPSQEEFDRMMSIISWSNCPPGAYGCPEHSNALYGTKVGLSPFKELALYIRGGFDSPAVNLQYTVTLTIDRFGRHCLYRIYGDPSSVDGPVPPLFDHKLDYGPSFTATDEILITHCLNKIRGGVGYDVRKVLGKKDISKEQLRELYARREQYSPPAREDLVYQIISVRKFIWQPNSQREVVPLVVESGGTRAAQGRGSDDGLVSPLPTAASRSR